MTKQDDSKAIVRRLRQPRGSVPGPIEKLPPRWAQVGCRSKSRRDMLSARLTGC